MDNELYCMAVRSERAGTEQSGRLARPLQECRAVTAVARKVGLGET
jgi:hypothetical protein